MMDDAKKQRAEAISRLENIFTDDDDDLPLRVLSFPNKKLYGDEGDNDEEEVGAGVNPTAYNNREREGGDDHNEEGDGDNTPDKVDLVSFPFP